MFVANHAIHASVIVAGTKMAPFQDTIPAAVCSPQTQRALFERYETRMVGFVPRMPGKRAGEQVYDLAMETFTRMFQLLAAY